MSNNDIRAALAEPVGEGPSADELIGLALEREPWATWLRSGGCLESAHCELADLMLAVLARCARPAAPPPRRPASTGAGGGDSVRSLIPSGAFCGQDFDYFRWPRTTDDPNTVFIMEKISASSPPRFCCRAPGYGENGNYGNGAIYWFPSHGIKLPQAGEVQT